MTSSLKNSPESDTQGKPGQSPRSNPVCLELAVTLRSLPTEAGSPAQPIREDLKTVIVFDNGAVVRSANNLAAGLTLIISNSVGRDVVCRVVSGRSMPAVKGYVEIEFIEPVKDFWGIHQEGGLGGVPTSSVAPTPAPPAPSPAAAPPSVPPVKREVPAAPPVVTPPPRPAPAFKAPPVPASATGSSTPEYDEFPAPMGMPSPLRRELKPEATNVAPGVTAKAKPEKLTPEYDHFEVASSTSVGNWTPAVPEPPLAKPSFEAPQETSSAISSSPAPTRDFMSKGLMAYEQPQAPTGASAVRTPLILGGAALVLAAVSGVVFFMHRGSAPSPVARAASSQPTVPQPAFASSTATSAPVQAAREAAAPAPVQIETQPQVQPIAAAPAEPAASVAPIPVAAAEVTNASGSQAGADSRSARRQDKSAVSAKPPDAPAPKRPMISNLKMGAPSAPNRNSGDANDGAAPITEIATEMPAGTTPAGELTSSGRTANPPAPPPSAPEPPPPPKVVTEPKLISSTRPVYPVTARQSNIEGSVTVVIYIDKTGKVFSARALSGPVMLRAAAEESVKQWKYSAGLEDGQPAQSHVVVKVDFKIN